MPLTRLSRIVQVRGIYYLQDIIDRGKIIKTLPTTTRPVKGDTRKSWILDSTLWILAFRCQWYLDCWFQSEVGFRIPWVESHIANFRISHSTNQLFLRLRYPDYIPYIGGNNLHKQTNKNNHLLMELDRSHTIKQFRYLPGDQTIDSENIDVLLLENAKEQKRNNEMPKGARLDR